MNEKQYKKRIEFQEKMITRQSEQIVTLKSQIEELENKCKEKDEIINSVSSLRSELTENVNKVKEYKEEYEKLIQDLKTMKKVIDQDVYKGRYWLIKPLLK